MSANADLTLNVSVEDFLELERLSATKHEYLAGNVYAMAGASSAHNILAANLSGLLYNALRGSKCQHFGSDMQVRLRLGSERYFYYPDAMIVCDPTDAGNGWRERPTVIFEILSESTRKTDEREKRQLYLNLQSLEFYVRLEQSRPELQFDRRTPEGWSTETVSGLENVFSFSLDGREVRLPLAELYERVRFGEDAG